MHLQTTVLTSGDDDAWLRVVTWVGLHGSILHKISALVNSLCSMDRV